MKYLKIIRDAISKNKIDELNKYFDDERDIDNIKRIIKGEIRFLDKKIKELENIIKNKQKEIKGNNDNKNEKNEDL